jgi:4-hydroxybenzoate polyprenyltransferase
LNLSTVPQNNIGTLLSRLKLFWALSRTPHALLDMAHPAMAALLCLGRFPSFGTTLLGILTVFSGYTAVYALNDLVDYRTDKEKMAQGLYSDSTEYLDGVLVRHPMAKGALSLKQGLLWVLLWGVVALSGAYLLNPVCMYIFIGGCVLESIYCLLWRVSPLRTLVNGVVKPLGAMAAVFAVNPSPSPMLLIGVFLWIFCWEIGGQNIPADWADIEEDRRFNAKTIPVIFGAVKAGIISFILLIISFFLNIFVFLIAPLSFNLWAYLTVVVVNCYLLLLPALKLLETNDRANVMILFNKSSYMPLATLLVTLFALIL